MSDPLKATLWYLKDLAIWKSTKPYFINVPQSALEEGQKSSNEISEPINHVPVRNMRDVDTPNDIDLCGFSVSVNDFAIPEEVFRDPAEVRKQYIPEVEKWLQRLTGAEIVVTLTSEVYFSLAQLRLNENVET